MAPTRRYLPAGATVVVVSTHTGNAGLLWQANADYYFRLSGGFLNEALRETAVPLPVADLISLHGRVRPRMVRRLRRFIRRSHITAILVETNSAPTWREVLTKIGLKPQYVDGVTIYRIPSPSAIHLSPGPTRP